jgi:hypothetical protein
MMPRVAFPLLALLVAGGCSGSDATDPMSPDTHPGSSLGADRSSPTEVTFEKWFTTFPTMTGNTSYGAGTFAGTILKATAYDNGVIVKLQAIYRVTDPSGSHSFAALIEGTENLETLTAVLNGVVTEGSMVGARVHVTFQVIRPCQIVAKPVCFQGTIRIQ